MPEEYVSHPLIEPHTVEYRKYQHDIAELAIEKNLLCVLPTGTGKTMIAVLTATDILQKYDGKIMMLSPTKPLCAQHIETFKECLRVAPSEIRLATGEVKPGQRKDLYTTGKIVIGTPQTIRNDIKEERFFLDEFSLLIFDEAQRAVKKYPYTFIASAYNKRSNDPRILGLTASPGYSQDRIKRVFRNLFIEEVQVRERDDEDVRPYVQQVKLEWEYVRLPSRLKKIKKALEKFKRRTLAFLKRHGYIDSLKVSKTKLLKLRGEIGKKLNAKDPPSELFKVISRIATALKLSHALELLETQGVTPLYEYFQQLKKDDSKAAQRLFRKKAFLEAVRVTEELYEEGIEHPKLPKLLQIIKKARKKDPANRIIVFVRYRSSVQTILRALKKEGINTKKLIGQRNGLTQQEQIATLNEFRNGEFNVLVTTSVGEEGLDIPSCKLAVFYDTVASAVRSIQRRGRVGRTKPGKVIVLLTKNTRDEGYFWAAYHKEKKMRKTLKQYEQENFSIEEWK